MFSKWTNTGIRGCLINIVFETPLFFFIKKLFQQINFKMWGCACDMRKLALCVLLVLNTFVLARRKRNEPEFWYNDCGKYILLLILWKIQLCSLIYFHWKHFNLPVLIYFVFSFLRQYQQMIINMYYKNTKCQG